MQIKHIFFDLDRTLWDFETNAYKTLLELYEEHALRQKGIMMLMCLLILIKSTMNAYGSYTEIVKLRRMFCDLVVLN